MPKEATGQPRGRRPGEGGRPAGSRNVWTQKLREELVAAFEDVGGRAYLIKLAKEQPAVFAGLISKLIPSAVEADIRTTNTLDLGLAMRVADARLKTIEHSPPRPACRSCGTLVTDEVTDCKDCGETVSPVPLSLGMPR